MKGACGQEKELDRPGRGEQRGNKRRKPFYDVVSYSSQRLFRYSFPSHSRWPTSLRSEETEAQRGKVHPPTPELTLLENSGARIQTQVCAIPNVLSFSVPCRPLWVRAAGGRGWKEQQRGSCSLCGLRPVPFPLWAKKTLVWDWPPWTLWSVQLSECSVLDDGCSALTTHF